MTTNNSNNSGTPNAGVPEGYETRELMGRERIQTVDRERLRKGAEVLYIKLDAWTANGEEYEMQVFQTWDKDGNAVLFGVWNTAQLGLLLRDVKANTPIFLRYNGKGPHPTNPSRTTHTWTVAVKPGAPAPVAGQPKQPDLPF